MILDEGGRPMDAPEGRVEQLMSTWAASRELRFDDWLRQVSVAYFASGLKLEGASKLLGTTPAELQGALSLATLDDDDLTLLASVRPPKTTWLSFSMASSAGVRAGVEAVRRLRNGDSPFHTVEDAIMAVEGPSTEEKILALPAVTITHMAKKAKQYNALSDRGQKALDDFARRRRTGSAMTPAQTTYLVGLLRQVVDQGAVKRDSPDSDQSHCDAVLDALGQP